MVGVSRLSGPARGPPVRICVTSRSFQRCRRHRPAACSQSWRGLEISHSPANRETGVSLGVLSSRSHPKVRAARGPTLCTFWLISRISCQQARRRARAGRRGGGGPNHTSAFGERQRAAARTQGAWPPKHPTDFGPIDVQGSTQRRTTIIIKSGNGGKQFKRYFRGAS